MKKLEDFILREIAGEYIMMPVGQTALKFSGLVMANDVSAFIWEHIEDAETVEELTTLICNEFEVPYEQAFCDTQELIKQMKSAGWIE